jgi:hypothetical protein
MTNLRTGDREDPVSIEAESAMHRVIEALHGVTVDAAVTAMAAVLTLTLEHLTDDEFGETIMIFSKAAFINRAAFQAPPAKEMN